MAHRTHRLIASVALAAALACAGCTAPRGGGSGAETRAPAALPDDRDQLDAIAGVWEMDLSPAQDGSYTRRFTIERSDADGAAPRAVTTFRGAVYGDSPFDNGQCLMLADGSVAFAFVSDAAGQQGGPYYWLGASVDDGTLRGVVRSMNRGLAMRWRAVRAAP